ncbi:carbon monoxide dehydrogenase subunit G [Deinococcus sp.]|uniref:CoxG family protein n=1 Tax=Deinococcus sp. TaxID=47478 RepID=UPI00286E0E7B|nr:carbon monoxide dehydrogenase subunit G [Deinococcus sp.]
MQVDGSNVIQAPRDRVWALLQDPEVLARCVPGVQEMLPDGPDSYTAILNVAVGPVKGKFKAKVKISNQVPPQSMTLQIEAKAPTGIVNAVGQLVLVEQGESTLVQWSGEPKLMGMIASLAGRLIGGISKSQADVFFSNLEKEAQNPVTA